ncbi:MAG: hypothetical protein AABX98_03610, partial [Nanoarchaeota archaeon]
KEIETEIDIEQRKLPTVDRDTYRPHAYLRAMGITTQEGRVPVSFIVPFPLREKAKPYREKAKPYEVQLKMYATEASKVPGLTINLGKNAPINIFFYANEITTINIGYAGQNEYTRLLVSRRNTES